MSEAKSNRQFLSMLYAPMLYDLPEWMEEGGGFSADWPGSQDLVFLLYTLWD